MKAYKINGEMEVDRREWQKFSMEIAAADEKAARETLMCDLGSRQGMKRRNIRIKTVTEIHADKIVSSAVKHRVGAK